MKELVRRRMPPPIFRSLLIDLEDRVRAGALHAHSSVRDHFKLSPKRARELEGQARFRMMEEGVEEVCKFYGGTLLQGGVVPLTDLKIFQPFSRFEYEGQGFILGLAAIPEPGSLPAKNMSRRAGVTLNYHLSPRLDLDGSGPQVGDIFILLLVARDRVAAGQIEEIAIGLIDSGYEQYLFYEPLQSYLQGYADGPIAPSPLPEGPSSGAIHLKLGVAQFVPPEFLDEKENGSVKKP